MITGQQANILHVRESSQRIGDCLLDRASLRLTSEVARADYSNKISFFRIHHLCVQNAFLRKDI